MNKKRFQLFTNSWLIRSLKKIHHLSILIKFQWLKISRLNLEFMTISMNFVVVAKARVTPNVPITQLMSPHQKQLKIIQDMVLTDRRLIVRQIVEAKCISLGSVVSTLNDHFSMSELYAKWVPGLLTMDKKTQSFHFEGVVGIKLQSSRNF